MADRLALLLHMHQPDYRDPRTGAPRMPWVRLHATRGYLDVAEAILATGAEVTVNVVPSLLAQLAACAEGVEDPWSRICRLPAEELEPAQIAFVRARFVSGHPAMRVVSPRYQELAARAAGLVEARDLRDLCVWSNLAWMGAVGRREPLVADLLDQDHDFDHGQLVALLDLQIAMAGRVLARWRELPSVSCSPSCHPILPLLVDLSHARRAMPELPEGPDFRWPVDAARQLGEARLQTEAHLGRRPDGLWPSEGSVSPEVAALAASAGYRWLASDEGVLHRSERDAPARVTGPWQLEGTNLVALFRDRDLSDRVGFRYARLPGASAAADLIAGAAAVGDPRGIVPVILDGENPWESYPDAGQSFMEALFRSGRLVTMDEAASQPPIGRIGRLHSGSWIDANFRIWAGDPEDRRGWALLAAAREAWEAAGRPEAGWPHLAAAEGSDWFWWFGPEFDTPVADLFDALFRGHLRAVWESTGLPAPESLDVPVRSGASLHPVPEEPGWLEGCLPQGRGGSMAEGQALLTGGQLWVGTDRLHLSLWLARPAPLAPPDARLEVVLAGVGAFSWPWAPDEERPPSPTPFRPAAGEASVGLVGQHSGRIEATLPAQIREQGALRLHIELRAGERRIGRWPTSGEATVVLVPSPVRTPS